MNYSERIVEDMKAAMKAGQAERVAALRMLRAAMIELQKSGQEVTEELELTALQKQAKMRKESITQYEEGGREDLAARERIDLAIIEEYLPRQLSDDELRAVVTQIIAETGATGTGDFKAVMPKTIAATRGLADGARVQSIVREELTKLEG